MAAPVVHLTFSDGSTENVTLNTRVLVEVERKFGTIPPIEGTLYGAWLRLGRPGTFDDWLDTIEDMGQSGEEDADRPTSPGASDGS